MLVTHASESMAMPPMRWLAARNFSAAKLRSANWLLKNMPIMAARGNVFKIQDCWLGVYPRLGRYPKINGNHAPQMKNSSTIMTNNFRRMALFIEMRGFGKVRSDYT